MNDNKAFFNAAFAENRDQWLYADSWYAEEKDAFWKKHSSACYSIQIQCTKDSGNTVADIGDSFANRADSNFGQDSAITITSTTPGVTYQEFLAQSESQPFIVGRTMIISTTSAMLERSVALRHRNATGDAVAYSINPLVDPYQVQTDRVIEDYEYIFDGMTRLRFTMSANSTVLVRMYLVSKYDATQIVAGRPSTQKYSPPHLIKAT